MMRRYRLNRVRVSGLVAAMALLVGGLASPASAQVVQVTRADARHSVGFNLGYFMVNGEDGRVDDDVLSRILNDLAFQVERLQQLDVRRRVALRREQLPRDRRRLRLLQRTVTEVYRDFVNDNGSEIAQDLKLRIVPITATIRFLPHRPRGGGRAVHRRRHGFFNWRYSESGEFVDFSDGSIFRAQYKADGTAVGPVIVGGVALPGGRRVHGRRRVQWQKAEGDTNPAESELLGSKIDLGGNTFSFTMHFRF